MTQAGADGEPEVGSLAEEAAKLLGVLSGWAHAHTDLGPTADDAVDDADDEAADDPAVDDPGAQQAAEGPQSHSHTSGAAGPGCSWCPACRALHAVRSLSPEVRTHLSAAATSLLHAAAEVLATAVPDDREGGRRTDVEHIDLDGDDWEDDR